MPLEPADLANFNAYAKKSKTDAAHVTPDGIPYWIYREFPLNVDNQKSIKTVLVVLQNRSKISSLLTGKKLASSGICAFEDGKLVFKPEVGKVPYKTLRQNEGKLFAPRKVMVPQGGEDDDGETPTTGPTTLQQTAPTENGSQQTPPQQPSTPGIPPLKAKFLQDFEHAKPLLGQIRSINVEAMPAPIKMLISQMTKTSAAMNEFSSKGDWSKASGALAMLVEGANHVLETKKQFETAQQSFQKDFADAQQGIEAILKIAPAELSIALQGQQAEIKKAVNAIAVAKASLNWPEARKVLDNLAEPLKTFTAAKHQQDEAKKAFGGEYNLLKSKIETVSKAKPGDLEEPLRQLHAQTIEAFKKIRAAFDAKDFVSALDLQRKLAPDLNKFSDDKPVNDLKLKVESEYGKIQSSLQEALGYKQTELAATLKVTQDDLDKAHKAFLAERSNSRWAEAEHALGTLKQELKAVLDGNRDQDLARRKYAAEYAGIKGSIDAVQAGSQTPPLDRLRQTAIDAHTAMAQLAVDLEFGAASLRIQDVTNKVNAYLQGAQNTETQQAQKIGNAKQGALEQNEEAIQGAKDMPADTSATDGVELSASTNKVLSKSKGLQEILDATKKIDAAWKQAVADGVPPRMVGVISNIELALELIAKYQKEHKATGDKDDQTKFTASEVLRGHLEGLQGGLKSLAEGLRFVGVAERQGDEGVAKACAVLLALKKNAKAPEAKQMLTTRYTELEGRLRKVNDNEDRQREIARLLGGDKEKSFFEARYNPLLPDIQRANAITTVTKATQAAKKAYDEALRTVQSAIATTRADYATAMSALPALKKALAHFLAVQEQATAEGQERTARRNKANLAFRGAKTEEERKAIAESMGGEVKEAYERQLRKGPMSNQANESKRLQQEQDKVKLLEGGMTRNAEMSRLVADRLINDEGEIDTVALFMNNPDDVARALGLAPHSKQLAKTLKKLRDTPALQEKLASIGKPDAKNPACKFIRASLGLPVDTEVTEVHARKAALSAMLSELRQKDVGSCFATSIAVRVHDADPGSMLDDLKELIETGKLVRTVPLPDGSTARREIPINEVRSGGQLKKKLTVSIRGNLRKTSGNAVPRTALSDTPPIKASIASMGVPDGRRAAVVNNALAALRGSSVQAALAAVRAKLPETVDDPVNVGQKLRNTDRDDLLAKMSSILAEQPDRGAARRALSDACPDTERAAVLQAFDEFFDPSKEEFEFTPEDVVRQSAMLEAGVTEADLAGRERLNELGGQLRALTDKDPTGPATKKVLEEYSRLSSQLTAKLSGLAAFDKLVDAGQNAYSGQEDDRLLRAWEYSVSSLAETGVEDKFAPQFEEAAVQLAEDQLNHVADDIDPSGSDPKVDRARDAIRDKFRELWKKSVRLGYDASKDSELSSDGSSSRGGFKLFDKAGIEDSNKHIPVDDKASYTKLIEGLINQAKMEVLKSEPDFEVKQHVERLGSTVSENATKRPDDFATGAANKLGRKNAWEVVAGHDITSVLGSYYGKDVTPGLKKKVVTGADDMTDWLLDQGRELLNNLDRNALTPDVMIPMGGGPHAWNFMPGDPKVLQVLDGGGGATEFKNEERDKYNKLAATRLTPELKASLVRDATAGWADAIYNELLAEVPDNGTAADFVTRVRDYIATNHPKFTDRAEASVTASLSRMVAPPVPIAEFDKHLDTVLNKLNLGDKKDAVKGTARSSFYVPSQPPPTEISMTDIEKAVARALKVNNLRQNEAAAAREVCQALRPEPKPPGLPFGDSNWGGGDHKFLITMVRNPISGNLEMWRCNEDGSSPSKMDQTKYLANKEYEMITDPSLVGGMIQ